jgi:hypothetical protein
MNKVKVLLLAIPTLLSFSIIDDVKELNLKVFKITIPKNWNYKKVQGEDSFVGEIITAKKSVLSFDYSNMGYANSLIPSEKEYLDKGDWLRECIFCKPNVTYTASFNVKAEKLSQMKAKGITDSSLVKVEAYPNPEKSIHLANHLEKQKYPKADYIALLTYKGNTISYPIQIPDKIKFHNIHIDTTDKYIIKTVWPKKVGTGMTAIYFHGRKNHLTFNLGGSGLSQIEQEQALLAFKTIKITE